MNISLIAALGRNKVIGRANDLPWRLPDDMKFFMETTRGHVVVMGRKNYDSIPARFRPLPDRTNVVITRQIPFTAPGCEVVHSFEAAIAVGKAHHEQELMVIGGAGIYSLALPMATTMYLTEINAEPEGDTFFPEFDKTIWQEVSRTPHPADARHSYSFDFVTYKRIPLQP